MGCRVCLEESWSSERCWAGILLPGQFQSLGRWDIGQVGRGRSKIETHLPWRRMMQVRKMARKEVAWLVSCRMCSLQGVGVSGVGKVCSTKKP